MLNLVIFGPPGCGKGTQSCRIAERYGLIHLSTGHLLRDEVRKETELGLSISRIMEQGLLVSDNLVLKKLYQSAIVYLSEPGLIFDGFPRTLYQAHMLDKFFSKKNMTLNGVIFLRVEPEELYSRLKGRAEDSGRSDDNDKVFLKRMQVYESQTQPLKDYYARQNKIHIVSGMAPVDEVTERIARVINGSKKRNN